MLQNAYDTGSRRHESFFGGVRYKMATLKQLKKALKKAGLKTTGSKRALTRRAKKARLMRGGEPPKPPESQEKQSPGQTQEEVKESKDFLEKQARAALAKAEAEAASGNLNVRPGGTRRR